MKSKRSAGYIDLSGVMTVLLTVGALFGLALAFGIPFVWAHLRPWLHTLAS